MSLQNHGANSQQKICLVLQFYYRLLMWLQKSKIYNGSCNQIGNFYRRSKYPKTTSHRIFFYVEKAYKATWKYVIMKDLHNLVLRGRLANFIKNFLLDRKLCIRIRSTQSNFHNQQERIPLGSILLVTLFNLKINIIKCLNLKTKKKKTNKTVGSPHETFTGKTEFSLTNIPDTIQLSSPHWLLKTNSGNLRPNQTHQKEYSPFNLSRIEKWLTL